MIYIKLLNYYIYLNLKKIMICENKPSEINNYSLNEKLNINYNVHELSKMSIEDLIKNLKYTIKNNSIPNITKLVYEFEKYFHIKNNINFKNENIKFDELHYSDFKKILIQYKKLKKEYVEKLESKFKYNLDLREEIINELKILIQSNNNNNSLFEKFNLLRDKWKKIGPIKKNLTEKIWKTYYHHVEKFYDYVKISDDIRNIEYQRNYKIKIDICIKSENLYKLKDLNKSFKKLQDLHEDWKQIGPVKNQYKEQIWNRFQEATKKIHKKRNDYYEQRNLIYKLNFEKKNKLSDKINKINYDNLKKHSDWKKINHKIEMIKKEWNEKLPINKNQNKQSWNKLTESLKNFKNKQNQFYKNQKINHKENEEKKIKLIEELSKIKDNYDCNETYKKFVNSRSRWKEIGEINYKKSEKIWIKYNNLCKYFFKNHKINKQKITNERKVIFDLKNNIIKKLKKSIYENTFKPKKIEYYVNKWIEISENKENIYQKIDDIFLSIIEEIIEKLKISNQEKEDLKFKYFTKISKLNLSKTSIKNKIILLEKKIKSITKNLGLLENNIILFKSKNKNNSIILNIREKIKEIKNELNIDKNKMNILIDYRKNIVNEI